jgi:hypothetical protein
MNIVWYGRKVSRTASCARRVALAMSLLLGAALTGPILVPPVSDAHGTVTVTEPSSLASDSRRGAIDGLNAGLLVPALDVLAGGALQQGQAQALRWSPAAVLKRRESRAAFRSLWSGTRLKAR